MYSLADSEERQIQAVQHLNRTGGSGLLLCYVGKVLTGIYAGADTGMRRNGFSADHHAPVWSAIQGDHP